MSEELRGGMGLGRGEDGIQEWMGEERASDGRKGKGRREGEEGRARRDG